MGKPAPRLEAREKVTGRALYTDDLSRPGMLHGAQLGSPFAHARIVSIDTGAAAALPGVEAVLTGEDFPRNYTGVFLMDQLPLAVDKVRYAGEPVAAVAAEDLATAREALRLIDIEYEDLDAVFDPEEALRPGAPVIHEERDSYECHYELPAEPNAICYSEFKEGDPEQAWSECDAIVENEYRLPAQYHMYLEPVSTLAEVDSNGKVTLWSSMQGVARVQMFTAAGAGAADVEGAGDRTPHRRGVRRQVRVDQSAGHRRVGDGGRAAGEDDVQPRRRHDDDEVPARRNDSREDRGEKGRDAGCPQRGIHPGRRRLRRREFGGFRGVRLLQPRALCHSDMRVRSWSVYTNRLRAGAMRGSATPRQPLPARRN